MHTTKDKKKKCFIQVYDAENQNYRLEDKHGRTQLLKLVGLVNLLMYCTQKTLLFFVSAEKVGRAFAVIPQNVLAKIFIAALILSSLGET